MHRLFLVVLLPCGSYPPSHTITGARRAARAHTERAGDAAGSPRSDLTSGLSGCDCRLCGRRPQYLAPPALATPARAPAKENLRMQAPWRQLAALLLLRQLLFAGGAPAR